MRKVFGFMFVFFSCPQSTPNPTEIGQADAKVQETLCGQVWGQPLIEGDNTTCKINQGDYKPNNQDDGWPPCISDDGFYHPFDPNISSIARVEAFEKIAQLLFKTTPPTPQEFNEARIAYAQDQGLESRVSRREDEHYPPANKKCQDMTEEELQQNKDRCVGPAQIRPLLNQAFKEGYEGKDPILNAMKIEAGLLWFLYLSVYKEAVTCATTKVDCDSHYAYYTGGETHDKGKGLSRYVLSLSKNTHERIWDGILAVRCWRDLDNGDIASDKETQQKALVQLDRALLRGMALIVMNRIEDLKQETCDEMRSAYWEGVRILGKVLLREANQRDKTKAKEIEEEISKERHQEANLSKLSDALQTTFPCP